MKRYITLFLTLALSSCTSTLPKTEARNLDEFYVGTGVEKYFLSELPAWSNFHSESECFRDKSIRFLNLDNLMKSYSLNYKSAIELQALFNEEYIPTKEKSATALLLKDEEILFYKANDRVNSKLTFFEAPSFKRIHLIWLDEVLSDKKKEEKLNRFIHSAVNDNGFPVFFSACLTKDEISKRFPGIGAKYISAEMYSVYDSKGERRPIFGLDINELFNKDQKIFLYMQDKTKRLNQMRGDYQVLNY